MKLNERQLDQINTHGYIVIDNFLPEALYKSLHHGLKIGRLEQVLQIKPNHYSHVFKSTNEYLPQEDESYIAKFSLVKGGINLNLMFRDHLVKVTHAIFPGAVKLKCGDVYRAHHDEYAGVVGYSYFLNDGWCADYGGILTYVKGSTLEPIFPVANRLLLRNETFKDFHFLNTVEQFCPKEQFIVLGWADTKKGESSKIRGDYLAI